MPIPGIEPGSPDEKSVVLSTPLGKAKGFPPIILLTGFMLKLDRLNLIV